MSPFVAGLLLFVVGVVTPIVQDPPGEFEVASIRVVEPLDTQKLVSGQQSLATVSITAGRVDMAGVPLGSLLARAFGVKPNQLEGPPWLTLDPIDQLHSGEARFDIHAKLPEGTTPDQVPAMLQALLVERFHLKFHREIRQQPGLALQVGKDGPRLDRPQVASSAEGEAQPKTGQPIRVSAAGMLHIERELTMDQLAGFLSSMLKRPVTDLTGLSGNYKVSLDLSPSDISPASQVTAAGRSGGGFDTLYSAAEPTSGISIFTSVERLGLKLESRRLPTDCVIIDQIDKLPTPN
jgi:uncharacterized protein (TIGR03435 family)